MSAIGEELSNDMLKGVMTDAIVYRGVVNVNTDLDTVTKPGVYSFHGAKDFSLVSGHGLLKVYTDDNENRGTQMIMFVNGTIIFRNRTNKTSGWLPWKGQVFPTFTSAKTISGGVKHIFTTSYVLTPRSGQKGGRHELVNRPGRNPQGGSGSHKRHIADTLLSAFQSGRSAKEELRQCVHGAGNGNRPQSGYQIWHLCYKLGMPEHSFCHTEHFRQGNLPWFTRNLRAANLPAAPCFKGDNDENRIKWELDGVVCDQHHCHAVLTGKGVAA